MNFMKVLKIIHIVGYCALLLAIAFSFVNTLTPERVFGGAVILPLVFVGIAGIACGIIYLVKQNNEDKANKTEQNDEKTDN